MLTDSAVVARNIDRPVMEHADHTFEKHLMTLGLEPDFGQHNLWNSSRELVSTVRHSLVFAWGWRLCGHSS